MFHRIRTASRQRSRCTTEHVRESACDCSARHEAAFTDTLPARKQSEPKAVDSRPVWEVGFSTDGSGALFGRSSKACDLPVRPTRPRPPLGAAPCRDRRPAVQAPASRWPSRRGRSSGECLRVVSVEDIRTIDLAQDPFVVACTRLFDVNGELAQGRVWWAGTVGLLVSSEVYVALGLWAGHMRDKAHSALVRQPPRTSSDENRVHTRPR